MSYLDCLAQRLGQRSRPWSLGCIKSGLCAGAPRDSTLALAAAKVLSDSRPQYSAVHDDDPMLQGPRARPRYHRYVKSVG